MLKMKVSYTLLTSLFLSLCIFFAHSAFAQTLTPFTLESAQNEVRMDINPQYPKPNEPFTVTLESFAVDLNSSEISFYENGKLLQSLTGAKTATYKNTGAKTDIKIIITKAGGESFTLSKTITPGSVTILWEANTLTPPFYKGRSLYTEESSFFLSALPNLRNSNGVLIPKKDVIYTWSINGKVRGTSSGLSRSSLSIGNERFLSSSIIVKVQAQSKDGNSIAESSITIPVQKTSAISYYISPLYGTQWGNALTNLSFGNQSEVEIQVFPLYFSTDSIIGYTWTLDGIEVNADGDSIVLRDENNGNAVYALRASLRSLNKSFESAFASLRIEA